MFEMFNYLYLFVGARVIYEFDLQWRHGMTFAGVSLKTARLPPEGHDMK